MRPIGSIAAVIAFEGFALSIAQALPNPLTIETTTDSLNALHLSFNL